jgi:UDP-N-acetylmuramate--alanine ligase
MDNKCSVAVCGSSGKTTVTAWLTETLFNLGLEPMMVGGGISVAFEEDDNAGNFRYGNGNFIVFEADESDKSLLRYSPDYALVTNLGTDHYPKDELKKLFIQFLKQVRKGVVVNNRTFEFLGEEAFKHLNVCKFDQTEPEKMRDEIVYCSDYKISDGRCSVNIHYNSQTASVQLPVPGLHSAWNFAAVFTACSLITDCDENNIISSAALFNGVVRRYNFKGETSGGCAVYDDYAHNVEKLISCLKTSQELAPEGKVLMIFQPHGFGPLGFMQKPLFEELEKYLRNDDIFAFLPVYYAGGTTSFKPESYEVWHSYNENGSKNYIYFPDRNQAVVFVRSALGTGDLAVVCGARDNSLSLFAEKIT